MRDRERGGERAGGFAVQRETHGQRESRGEGGSSSSWGTTYMGNGTEWSATGRLGVSLAALSGLQDATFSQMRAASRLQEMLQSKTWPHG